MLVVKLNCDFTGGIIVCCIGFVDNDGGCHFAISFSFIFSGASRNDELEMGMKMGIKWLLLMGMMAMYVPL